MSAPHPLAKIERIWRYPVKSLKAEPLDRTAIGFDGLEGDRRRALFVTTPGHARADKTFRGKEDNRLHLVREPDEAVAVAESAGVAVTLRDDGPFFDSRPVSLLFDCWVAELEAILGFELDPLRFRPNLFARALEPLPREPNFVGAVLQVGGARLRVVARDLRCVTPTYDVATGEPNPEILRAVAQYRENMMGVYCTVEAEGDVAIGDAIVGTVPG